MSKGKTKSAQESFYYKFVQHEDDVVGLLSYALYQKAWQHHKENLKREKYSDGAIPASESVAYQSMFESQIPAHRIIAEQMLNKRYEEFAHQVFEQIKSIDGNLQVVCSHSNHIPSISDRVHKRVGFFGFSFWQNVVASAALPILLGVLILLYNLGSGADLWPFESSQSSPIRDKSNHTERDSLNMSNKGG